MFTIIWGHTKLTGISNEFVYAFHIPLFFFMSGMVFRSNRYASFGDFLKRKWQTLLKPYIIFSFATWILWALYSYLTHAEVDSYWMPLLQTFIAQGSGGFLEHNVPLWFVSCLFVVEVMYWFVSRLKDGTCFAVSVLCALLGYVLVYHCKFWDFKLMPWSIDVALMALVFYATGNLVVKKFGHEQLIEAICKRKVLSYVMVIIGFAITAVLGHYEGAMSMGHARMGSNPLIFYVTAFIGIASMLTLCVLLSAIEWDTLGKNLSNGIKWFGRHSFDAMAIHNPIRQVVMVCLAIMLHTTSDAMSENTVHSLVSFVVTLVATSIGMMVIDYIREHWKQKNVKSI